MAMTVTSRGRGSSVPKDNLRKRSERDGVPYVAMGTGRLHYADARQRRRFSGSYEVGVRELCEHFDVREVAFDPYLARNMLNNLLEDGLPAVEMRQGYVTMAPAIKEMERAIIAGRFKHGGHPVLRWNFSNICVQLDKIENKTFHKGRSSKIVSTARTSGRNGRWSWHSAAITRGSVYSDAWPYVPKGSRFGEIKPMADSTETEQLVVELEARIDAV